MDCPCGTNKKYEFCCKIAHTNITVVQTAVQLMRSRYTAFTRADGDYLMKSHHSDTHQLKEMKSIASWAKSVSWIRLEILEIIKGSANDSEGTVTFNAYFYEDGKVNIIHEKSAFVKENGIWMYVGLAK